MKIICILIRVITESIVKRNTTIITYNYDEFLEIDYKKIQPNSVLVSITNDVNYYPAPSQINHVHGLMPYSKRKPKNIILSQEDYFDNYSKDTWTKKIQENALKENVCLFIGSSMSDLFQMSLINNVVSDKNLVNQPKIYSLLCFKNLSNKDKIALYNYYNRKGINVIYTDDYKDLPERLRELLS